MKTIYHWQTANQLGDSLGRSWQQITKFSAHPYKIERKPAKPGGQPLFRVNPEERDSQLPEGFYLLEWDGYIDVHDGGIGNVIKTFWFHDVDPAKARILAAKMCEEMNGEVAA